MASILGLDIGSQSIKLVEIERDGKGVPKLISAGGAATPPKSLTSTIQADKEALAQTIKQLLKDTGAKSRAVHFALPESQVFTRVISMPQLSQRELASAIKWEAEQYIPLPLDQVNLDYTVLRDNKLTGNNTMEILLLAAPKTLLEKYMMYADMSGLTPVGAETEVIAASRALASSVEGVTTVMIVSIGALTTEVAIVRRGILSFTRSISTGGDAITRAIAQGLEFTPQQAEEYKRTYGLLTDQLEGKVFGFAKPMVDTIVGELKRIVVYNQEKYKDERIDSILLSGGTAKLPGMIVYIAENMGTETQLANPWVGIVKDQRFSILDAEGPTFAVAVGLALK